MTDNKIYVLKKKLIKILKNKDKFIILFVKAENSPREIDSRRMTITSNIVN